MSQRSQSASTQGYSTLCSICQLEYDTIISFFDSAYAEMEQTIAEYIPYSIHELQNTHEQSHQLKITKIIANYASETAEQTEALIYHGAIPVLIEQLKSKSSELIKESMLVLVHITGHSSNSRDIFLRSNLLQIVLYMSQNYTHYPSLVLQYLSKVIKNLSQMKIPSPQPIFAAQLLQCLQYLLNVNDTLIQEQNALSLKYLTEHPFGIDAFMQSLADNLALIETMIKLLDDKSNDDLLDAIGNAMAYSYHYTEFFWQWGIVQFRFSSQSPITVRLKELFKNEDISSQITSCITNENTESCVLQAKGLIGSGIIEAVCSRFFLKDYDATVLNNALQVLEAILDSERKLATVSMLKCNCLERLSELIDIHHISKRIRAAIEQVIEAGDAINPRNEVSSVWEYCLYICLLLCCLHYVFNCGVRYICDRHRTYYSKTDKISIFNSIYPSTRWGYEFYYSATIKYIDHVLMRKGDHYQVLKFYELSNNFNSVIYMECIFATQEWDKLANMDFNSLTSEHYPILLLLVTRTYECDQQIIDILVYDLYHQIYELKNAMLSAVEQVKYNAYLGYLMLCRPDYVQRAIERFAMPNFSDTEVFDNGITRLLTSLCVKSRNEYIIDTGPYNEYIMYFLAQAGSSLDSVSKNVIVMYYLSALSNKSSALWFKIYCLIRFSVYCAREELYSVGRKALKCSYNLAKNGIIFPHFMSHEYKQIKRFFQRQLEMIGCEYCGKRQKKLKLCKQCMISLYCSRRCQKMSWVAKHRNICNKSPFANVPHNYFA